MDDRKGNGSATVPRKGHPRGTFRVGAELSKGCGGKSLVPQAPQPLQIALRKRNGGLS
jgi:hypothetical protein